MWSEYNCHDSPTIMVGLNHNALPPASDSSTVVGLPSVDLISRNRLDSACVQIGWYIRLPRAQRGRNTIRRRPALGLDRDLRMVARNLNTCSDIIYRNVVLTITTVY